MTNKEDIYWLQLAIEEFNSRVWNRGLSKFALDKEIQSSPDRFSYPGYSIDVNRPDDDSVVIDLSSDLDHTKVRLKYYVEFSALPPEILSDGIGESIELLETISELWSEDLFSRKKS